MKQRIFLLLFAAFQLAATTARADEGMWLLHMLQRINEAEMQQMGLNLSAEDIYSLNQACLKDAVITLNGGSCTAEIPFTNKFFSESNLGLVKEKLFKCCRKII